MQAWQSELVLLNSVAGHDLMQVLLYRMNALLQEVQLVSTMEHVRQLLVHVWQIPLIPICVLSLQMDVQLVSALRLYEVAHERQLVKEVQSRQGETQD